MLPVLAYVDYFGEIQWLIIQPSGHYPYDLWPCQSNKRIQVTEPSKVWFS